MSGSLLERQGRINCSLALALVVGSPDPSVGSSVTLIVAPAPEAISAGTPARAREVRALRTRFIDGQGAALEGLSIQPRDCALNVFALAKLDKTEPSRGPSHLIANHHGRGHSKARIGYKFAERRVGSAMG